jgi:hypothetical protein
MRGRIGASACCGNTFSRHKRPACYLFSTVTNSSKANVIAIADEVAAFPPQFKLTNTGFQLHSSDRRASGFLQVAPIETASAPDFTYIPVQFSSEAVPIGR